MLVERTMRRLGIWGLLKRRLPARSPASWYSSVEGAYSLVAGLVLEGRGICAAEGLRDDPEVARIFGLSGAVPEEATMERVLEDLAGLEPRTRAEAYAPAGPCLARLGLFGEERKGPRLRRVVPETPERASAVSLEAMAGLTGAVARACLRALPQRIVKACGFWIRFGDGTNLEVEGHCFDAARRGPEGKKQLRTVDVRLGPITIAEDLGEGNRDEGKTLPLVLRQAEPLTREIVGVGRVLDLLDSAYFEKAVMEELGRNPSWRFIVGANEQRVKLTAMAEEQPEAIWQETGGDAGRGWRRSQVCVFAHQPEGWPERVTIVARRWEKAEELPGLWDYAFVGTNLTAEDLPKSRVKKHGYGPAVWRLYDIKQGCENHFKTPLIDFGLHHPPSSRLGLNQVYYALATVAVNVAMVIRYRVMPGKDRGMRFWRLRQRYLRLAGIVTENARTLLVRLAGGVLPAARQKLWLEAFATAGRL